MTKERMYELWTRAILTSLPQGEQRQSPPFFFFSGIAFTKSCGRERAVIFVDPMNHPTSPERRSPIEHSLLGALIACVGIFAVQCGGDDSSPQTCGAGTVSKNNVCVPDGIAGSSGSGGSAGTGGTAGASGAGGTAGTGGTASVPPCPADPSTIAYQCDREAACEGVPSDRTHSCETECFPSAAPDLAVNAPFDGTIRIRADIGPRCTAHTVPCKDAADFVAVETIAHLNDLSGTSVLVFEVAEPWRITDGSYDVGNGCYEKGSSCAYVPLAAGSTVGSGKVWFVSSNPSPPVTAVHTYSANSPPTGCKKISASQ